MIQCFFISDLELIRSENWDTLHKILFFKIVILHLYGYNTTRTLIGIFKRKEIYFTLVGNSSHQRSSSTVLKINHILFSKRFKSLVTKSKGVKPSAFLQFTSNMADLDFEAWNISWDDFALLNTITLKAHSIVKNNLKPLQVRILNTKIIGPLLVTSLQAVNFLAKQPVVNDARNILYTK